MADKLRKVLFMGYWYETWQQLLDFLQEKEYQDTAMIEHIKELLEDKK